MNRHHSLVAAAILTSALGLGACQQQKQGPEYAPSTGYTGYALEYPKRLDAARNDFMTAEGDALRIHGEMESYAGELKDTDWNVVTIVVDTADAEGRTAAYAERARSNQAAETFFEEEGDELVKKVGGATQYAVKQAGCKADTYGAAKNGLEKGVEERLEERMREQSEAHRFIDELEEQIGKPNVPKLRDQADAISRASYLSHIAAYEAGEDLKRLTEQASAVSSTLDDVAKDAKKIAEDPETSEERKKVAQQRASDAEESKRLVDKQLEQVKPILEQLEQRLEDLKKKHTTAIDQLKQTLKSNVGA